jgi:hypothetical protein
VIEVFLERATLTHALGQPPAEDASGAGLCERRGNSGELHGGVGAESRASLLCGLLVDLALRLVNVPPFSDLRHLRRRRRHGDIAGRADSLVSELGKPVGWR